MERGERLLRLKEGINLFKDTCDVFVSFAERTENSKVQSIQIIIIITGVSTFLNFCVHYLNFN